jgi:pyruvate/2-oxoglutarate dehydrogenase complex dihydrolipoamide acyltransferase (E2) component
MSPEPKTDSIRLTAVRRMIAEKMHASLHTSAQLSYHADVDATALVQARAAWRERGVGVGYDDLLAKVIADVVPLHPQFNAIIDGDTANFESRVHVSIAVALPGALVAPAIFDVDQKSIPEILEARQDLLERARLGKLTIAEMTGGTITVSNLGQSRVRHFTPILNAPQMAILGFGRIAPRPWVDAAGHLCVRQVMGVSLTTDHRFVDGEPSARFLSDVCERLEQAVPEFA